MVIGLTIIVISIAVAAIWVFFELRRFKHKLWAILIIGLILFAYISFSLTLRNESIDYRSFSGLRDASKLYVAWLIGVFGNLKAITSNAINMNWGASNSSIR